MCYTKAPSARHFLNALTIGEALTAKHFWKSAGVYMCGQSIQWTCALTNIYQILHYTYNPKSEKVV